MHTHLLRTCVCAYLCAAVAVQVNDPPKPESTYDVVIANGYIIDGTGSPGYQADIAIKGDRIARIGKIAASTAARVIDAHGLVVAPGFIDMLGQSEWNVLIDPRAESKVYQGITTEVTGEGSSIGPINSYQLHEMADVLKHEKLSVDWTSLSGYFKRLQDHPPAINLATYIGTGQVRDYVMRNANRAPSPAELAQMCQLVDKGMHEGAIGVSSALQYPPNSFAKTDELIALAKVAAKYGGVYGTHMRNEADTVVPAIDEAIRIGKQARIAVEIFHLKTAGKKNWGRMSAVLSKIKQARASGLRIAASQYPYTAASNDLSSSLPDWVEEGGKAKMVMRLTDRPTRERIKREIRHPKLGVDDDYVNSGGGSGILISKVINPTLRKYEGKRLSEAAKMMNKADELDALLDLIVLDNANTEQIMFIMSEQDVRLAMKQDWISVCTDYEAQALSGPLAEGNPHPRAFGTFPRILGHFVRDLHLLSLEQAIHKMTNVAAEHAHLVGRGQLKPGCFADIVVFDRAQIADMATYERPRQLSQGMRYVMVNGEFVIEQGKQTTARPGRPLYGPGYQSQPELRKQ